MLPLESICACMPSFRSVAPKVFLAKQGRKQHIKSGGGGGGGVVLKFMLLLRINIYKSKKGWEKFGKFLVQYS